MRLSIVIVNWNTTQLLSSLLASIKKNAPSFEYEVIVVDNASDDLSEERFRQGFPDVTLIVNGDNAGYAKGNNQALAICRGDYVLLLNPDTEATTGALETLVEFMESHKEAGAAGAKLVRPDGSVDRSVRGFPYPGPIALEYMGMSRLFPKSRVFGSYRMTFFTYSDVEEVDQPMGSCLILSRSALEDVGLMDEQFPIFFNEVDWLYRAKQAGYKVYFVPDATFIHHGGSSTGQVCRRKMVRESHDSLLRFYTKHFKGRISTPIYYFTTVCIKLSRFLKG